MTSNVSATVSNRLSVIALWWGVPLAGLALVALLTGDLNREWFDWLNQNPPRGLPGPAWASITVLGDALLLLSLGLLLVYRAPALSWSLLLAALVATAVSHTLKDLLDVARPVAALGRDAVTVIGPALKQGALPSGHTTAIFTFAGLVGVARPRWLPVLLPVALAVALSRVVVGAHWPQDVAAGAALGWMCGVLGPYLVPVRLAAWRPGQHLLGMLFLGCAAWLPFRDTGYPGTRWLQALVALVCIAAGLLSAYRARATNTPPATRSS